MSWLDLFNNHELTIWRRTETLNANGTPAAGTWEAVATGVACQFQPGKSQHAVAGFVLSEVDNIDTFDPIFTAQGVDLRSGDVVKQTSGPEEGNFWTIRGNPQINDLLGNQSVLASRTDRPPNGVS